MTTKVSPSIESAFSKIKDSLINEEREQVFQLNNGGRIVYHPPNSISREKGFKNLHAKEYTLVSPNGALVKVVNIAAFCRDIFGETEGGYPKYASSFSDMFNGIRKEDNVMGWKVYEEDLAA